MKQKQDEIVDSIYKAYGSDSGVLFGIKERDAVKAIVEFTLNRITPATPEPLKDNKNNDWDLYPGNEAGAFDHLDNAPLNDNQEGFTGGEWKVKIASINSQHGVRVMMDKGFIQLYGCKNQQEAEANAALIADAKNLYHALRNANFQLREMITDKFGEDVANMSGLLKANEAILNRINSK